VSRSSQVKRAQLTSIGGGAAQTASDAAADRRHAGLESSGAGALSVAVSMHPGEAREHGGCVLNPMPVDPRDEYPSSSDCAVWG
jgi:hypothetical protein